MTVAPRLREVLADGPKRRRTAEVADHRHDQVPGLQILEKPEARFSGQIAALLAIAVSHRHQVGIAGRVAEPATVCERIAEVGALGKERRPIDVIDAFDVAGWQTEPVLLPSDG